MGGGVGLSLHGSHRVAGERYPVRHAGGRHRLLSRMSARPMRCRGCPGETGIWLALTGARVKAADALALGLATHAAPSAAVPAHHRRAGRPASPSTRSLAAPRALAGPAPAAAAGPMIDQCFVGHSVADDPGAAGRRRRPPGSDFAADAAAIIRDQVAHQPLDGAASRCGVGAGLDFEEAMALEFRIVSRMVDTARLLRRRPGRRDRQGPVPAAGPGRRCACDSREGGGYFAPLARPELVPPEAGRREDRAASHASRSQDRGSDGAGVPWDRFARGFMRVVAAAWIVKGLSSGSPILGVDPLGGADLRGACRRPAGRR